MNWYKTVMNAQQITDTIIGMPDVVGQCITRQDEEFAIARAQAEISFKAGIETAAEFVDTHRLHGGNISIPKFLWQAKKKEWG